MSQDWRIVGTTILKLSGGSESYGSNLDIDAFLEQAKQYDEALSSARVGKIVTRGLEASTTHPV